MKIKIIHDLIALADALDQSGMNKEAGIVDSILKTAAAPKIIWKRSTLNVGKEKTEVAFALVTDGRFTTTWNWVFDVRGSGNQFEWVVERSKHGEILKFAIDSGTEETMEVAKKKAEEAFLRDYQKIA